MDADLSVFSLLRTKRHRLLICVAARMKYAKVVFTDWLQRRTVRPVIELWSAGHND